MCRLGGLVLSTRPRTTHFYDGIAANLLALLTNMEKAYGGDGVSITFHYPDGHYYSIKEHRHVQYTYARYDEIRQSLEGVVIVQLHARLGTGGDSRDHKNLHPFHHGDIVGCHNGVIYNDDSIWNTLTSKPYSQVDSEAIFAKLNETAPDLSTSEVQRVIDTLYGSYAITAVNTNNPTTLFLLAGENPLCYYRNPKTGILWYASTEDLLPAEIFPKQTKKEKKGKKQVANRQAVELLDGQGMYITARTKYIEIRDHMFDMYLYPYASQYYGYGYGKGNDTEWIDYIDYREELEDWLIERAFYTEQELIDKPLDELEDMVATYKQYLEEIDDDESINL